MKLTTFVNNKRFQTLGLLAVTTAAMFATDTASARTWGDAATAIQAMFGSFGDVVMGGMFLTGLGIGGLSALKFKEHSDNPQQVKLTKPIIYAIVAAALVGLPAYIDMSSATLNGEGSAKNGLGTGVYNNL